jgi:hypothetical protein
MRARKLIIETLLKEATEEEKLVAAALDDAFDELEADLKANKDKLAPEMQNEAVGFAIAGSIVSLPALLKLIGKAVAKVQSKLKGENVDTNTIIKVADKLHHLLIGGVEKVLQVVFRIKDKKTAHRLAVIIFHAIVAGLLIASGSAFFKALQKHNTIMSVLEGLLSAIKSGELGVFLIETFGEIAQALGLGAELADAADLADAIEGIEELSEISTMAGGSVQGYSLPLGAKPEDYKMENKLRITKGRLRQILAEEVARHQKQKLNEADEGGAGVHDIFNLPEPKMPEPTGNPKEDALRQIVAQSQAAEVDGVMVDLFTASTILSVLDAINPANKEKLLKLPVGSMAKISFKMLKEEKTDMLEEAAHDYEGVIEGDFVNIIGGALTGAIGRVVELTISTQGKPALVVRLTKDADMKVYGKSGDEVIVQPKFVEKDQGMYSMTTLEEMGAKEEEAEADELAAETLEEGMGSLAYRRGFADGREAKGMPPEDAEKMAKAAAKEVSGDALNMLQLTGLESASPEQYQLAMQDVLASSVSATKDYLEGFAKGYGMMSEEKTDKHDAEMKEKGFSDAQAKNLPDELQKSILKKEVRAMIEEMLNEELLCEECGGMHEGSCPGK